MDKAILILDEPEKCSDCPLLECIIGKVVCNAIIKRVYDDNKKPDWCPLKPINPNLIKALCCLESQDNYGNCYITQHNRSAGKQEMTCKGILDTIPCPYNQDEYNTDMGSDECGKWLNELADMLEGKDMRT